MTQRSLKLVTITAMLCLSVLVQAQSDVNSPYSISGLGLLQPDGFMHQRMMGGVSAINDSTGTFSFANPATLSNTSLTNMEFGASFDNVRQQNGTARNDYNTGAFEYVALGIPISLKKKIGLGIGIKPYSRVEYFIQNETKEDSLSVGTTYNGGGGLDQFQIALGGQIAGGWSIGYVSSIIFGKIERNTDKQYITNPNVFSFRTETTNFYNGISHRIGAQYNGQLSGTLRHSFGAAYTLGSSLELNRDNFVRTYNSAGNFFIDTVQLRSDPSRKVELPSGFTISYGLGNRTNWFVGAQMSSVKWSEFTDVSNLSNYFDETKYSLGGYIQPMSYGKYKGLHSRKERSRSYLAATRYYFGLSYKDSYVNSFSEQISEVGINVGVGLPIIRSAYIDENKKIYVISRVNIGVGYAQRGKNENGLIQENILQVRVGTNFNDKWFTKRRYK